MNWGKGLALAMIAFAGMMAYFLVRAAQNPEPLITEGYYEQELVYQARIEATAYASSLGAMTMHADQKNVTLTFPALNGAPKVVGHLKLIRTNEPALDRDMDVSQPADGQPETIAVDLVTGQNFAQLEWSVNGRACYSEQRLIVP
jgi:hypothetical protein